MAIGAPVGGTNLVVSAATNSWAVPYPASVLSTDYLVMRFSMADTTAWGSDPSGWTRPAATPSAATDVTASGTTTPRVTVFVKQAAGGETGNLTVTTPASTTGQARMYKVSGVDAFSPLDTTPTTVSLSATTAYNIPSLTTVTDGCLLFGLVGSNTSGSGTFTPPTILGTWTELLDVNTNNHSSDAYFIMGAAGATGIANFVRSGSVRGGGVLLALRPTLPSPIIVQPPRRP